MAQTQLVPEYEGKVGENCYLDALEMNYSETGGRQKWHYKGDIFVNKVYGGNNKMTLKPFLGHLECCNLTYIFDKFTF